MLYIIHYLFPIFSYYLINKLSGFSYGGDFLIWALILIVWEAIVSTGINKLNFRWFYLVKLGGILSALSIWRVMNWFSIKHVGNLEYSSLIPLLGLGAGYIYRNPKS